MLVLFTLLYFAFQKLFIYLIDVDQSPRESMQSALSPLMKSLVAGKLFKHSDADVKVAVAACVSEITRITAPEAPYDDDQMKVCSIFFFIRGKVRIGCCCTDSFLSVYARRKYSS